MNTCVLGGYPLLISKILFPRFPLLLVLCPDYSIHFFSLVRDSTMLYTDSLACAMIWGLSKAASWIKEELTSFVFIILGILFFIAWCQECWNLSFHVFQIFYILSFFKKLFQLGESLWFLLFHLGWKQKSLQSLLTSFSYSPHFLWHHFIFFLRLSNWSSSLKSFFKKAMVICLFNLFNEFWVQ